VDSTHSSGHLKITQHLSLESNMDSQNQECPL
jgi:hypothetical protein